METFQEFVGAGSMIEAFYWLIAIVFSAYFVIQLTMSLIGLDMDFELDIDIGVGDVSFAAVAAFLAAGGWVGVVAYNSTSLRGWAVLGVAAAAGLVTFLVTVVVFSKLKSLEEHGNLDEKNAVGKIGTVYLTVPGDRKGEGQIQVVVQEKLIILEALTEGRTVSTGEKVMVFGTTEEGKLLVEPYQDMISEV